MRADRLLSLLLLLQMRGRMTAEALAAELEVSERTIYRDIDALSTAGVPVYGERGPEGGYALLDGYRTNLTGLTGDEMRAFFMLSIPAPLADLGVGKELKAALLKLSAALPAGQRNEEERVRQRFHLDSTWWSEGNEDVPHLQTIQQAIWHDRRLFIAYATVQGIAIEQVVEPLGLVAKAGVWYLVYAHNHSLRARRVSSLRDAVEQTETFERPAGFDLVAFWQDWCAGYESSRSLYAVTVRVSPAFVPMLPMIFGEGIYSAQAQPMPPDAGGWLRLNLSFESLYAARQRILACGGGVEVLEPEPLRLSVADFARQTVGLYSTDST
jgi:predicted DNA-binding transcriptional regulator YafY